MFISSLHIFLKYRCLTLIFKISERATNPFERPVDIKAFPDYLQYVENPMELQTVQKRIEQDYYITSEDFEVRKIFFSL